jgi:hypothetical protein
MPDSYHEPTFYVEASNIHFGNTPPKRFGPYTGFAMLTYENLRRSSENANGPEFLFTFVDPEDVGEGNPHGYESWTGEDGDERYFGWRESVEVDDGNGRFHQELRGPFYTDLVIVTDRDS